MNRTRGFTLLELLVVLSIMAVFVAFTIPVMGLLRSVALSQEVEWVVGELKKARQTAIAENRTLEVRLYSHSGDRSDREKLIRAIQVWKREDSGQFSAVSAIHRLEEPVIISEDPAITRIGGSVTPVTEEQSGLPRGYSYRTFQFFPDGSTNLNLSEQWYFTMHLEFDPGAPPSNFATIQIEPLTGAVNVYRP